MTDEERIRLENLQLIAETRFAEAAERCRAGSEAMGLEPISGLALADLEAWRAEAQQLGLLAAASSRPARADAEPEGLSPELSLRYRQFRAQLAAAE